MSGFFRSLRIQNLQSTVCSDDAKAYRGLERMVAEYFVLRYSKGEYARGDVFTNKYRVGVGTYSSGNTRSLFAK